MLGSQFADSIRRSVAMMKLLFLVVLILILLPSCVAPNEVCSPQELGSIEENFITEIYFRCKDFSGPNWRNDCPDYPSISEKYRKQRDAWVRCQ